MEAVQVSDSERVFDFDVSVVIVNWKTPKLLARCLDSLKEDPGYERFELIVVENNSGDESVPMLKEQFPFVRLIENKENAGFSKGCNQAIVVAKGRHILLLNPDSVIIKDAISTMCR